MLSEEEKNAIEYLKARLYGNEGCKFIDVAQSDLRIFLNLVENHQKDIKNLEKICDEQEDNITLKDNKICDLEFEIEKLQKEIYRLQNIKRKDIEELINNEKENIYINYISKDKIRERKK